MPGFGITSVFLTKVIFILFSLTFLIIQHLFALSKLLNIDFKYLRVLERILIGRVMFFTNFVLISYVILNYSVVVASRFFDLYYAGHIITLIGYIAILYAVYSVNRYADEYFENERKRKSSSLG